jgi:cellulose synthase/poly-beta-1,6-N-acetylglucosamine synthase-like glycosyltransferase
LQYDGVVIVDADTIVDPNFAISVAGAAPLNRKAVQGYNGVLNPEDNAITRMAAVFADAKGRFAHRLKARAGLNVPLRLGGCIGTSVLAEQGWNAFSIGEDWELYVLLTVSGVQIQAVDNARVYAQEARSLRQSASQRKRWTAGKLTVLWRLLPVVLRSRCIGALQKLDLIAELSGPGPAVHLGAALLLAVASGLLAVPGARMLILALGAGILRQVCYTVAALSVQPRPWRAALAFAHLPFYAAWRVAVEITALGMLGDKPWVRTDRHGPAPG